MLLQIACGTPTGQERGLVVALESEPHSIDARFSGDAAASRVGDLIHLGLTRARDDGSRAPALASSWAFTDARSVVFRLRSDFRFPDGAPVTATDVQATYEAVLDPALGSPKRAALAAIAAVEAPDAATIVLRLRESFAPILDGTGLGILPASRVRAPDEVRDGAGPFRVLRIDPGERLVLGPNPGWPDGRPEIERIVLRVVPDPLVRALDLRRGGIGLTQDVPEPELLDWLAASPDLRVRRRPGTSFAYLAVNLRDPRLAQRRVRRALAMALDREALLASVLGGTGRIATGLLAPEHWAYAPARVPPYDPARARRLLDRAGFPDPDGPGPLPRFRLVYKTSTVPTRRRLAEAVQAQLAAVGVALDVRTQEWATLYADVRAGRFELASMAWVGVTDPDLYYLTLHSAMTPPAGYNRGYYASRVVDRLTARGRRLLDSAARRAVYARLQRLAARDLPVVPLWWEDRIAVYTARLDGFEPQASGELTGLANAHLH